MKLYQKSGILTSDTSEMLCRKSAARAVIPFGRKKTFAKFTLLLSVWGFGTLVQAATDCNTVTEISVAECQSLIDLYNSTNGPNWADNTGWNVTNTPCSWFGVTCDAGHVSNIDLMFNQLSGNLPNLNLPNLVALELSGNELSGSIPTFSLLNLQSLALQYNQLSGNIPNFNLPSLFLLALNDNQLSGTIPNINFSSPFLILSLEENCGLTAYDVTQESLLNSKNPGWQTQSVTCPSVDVPNISVTPTTYDFEDLNVGSSLLPQTFTVSNTGNGNLQISGVTMTNSTDFSLSGNCAGQTLAASQTCAIQVAPSPKSTGLKENTVSIASNAPSSTVSVKVNGVNIQKPLTPLSTDSAVTSPVLKSGKVTQNDVISCGKWTPVGFGVKEPYGLDSVTVTATAYDKNNNLLYVGGSFKKATDKSGEKVVNGIAKWNPVTETWSPLGTGVSGGYVATILISKMGNVYIGGTFTHAGGKLVNHIAKWNGSDWSALGSGTNIGTDNMVASLATDPTDSWNRYLYVGGQFTSAGGVSTSSRVAQWDGLNSTWKKVGALLSDVEYVHSIIFDKNGQLYVSGKFTINYSGDPEQPFSDVAKLASNGMGWEPPADSIGKTWDGEYGAIALATDGKANLYAGGDFSITNSNPYSTVARKIAMNNTAAGNLAKWTGLTKWGLDNLVVALAVDGENNLYAGGTFSYSEDFLSSVKRVAKWDGTKWNPLGDGLSGENGSVVQSLTFDGSSNLYAGGTFDLPGGSNIAKWVDCVKPCPQPATIESKVITGDWTNPKSWNPERKPDPTDVVLIKKGHTITGPYDNRTVKGVCNYGTIQSGSQVVPIGSHCDWYWTVEWRCGGWLIACGWIPVQKCRTITDYGTRSSLDLTASNFLNNYGNIQRVSNSDTITLKTLNGAFNNYSGAKLSSVGGSISVSAKQIANYGASSALGMAEITGGTLSLLATNDFTNYGKISGTGTIKASGNQTISNGVISLSGSKLTLDPQLISLLEDTKIEAEEVVIVGGDDAVLDLSGLSEGTITTKKLTIAVGQGGTVDLTGTPANAIQADEVRVFADNIVLDEGKQLTDSINTANVTVEPAKILYDVSIISPTELAGKMGEVLPVKVAIANTGPKVDTYTLTVTSKLGWNLSAIPATLTVETHEQSELTFDVTLPVISDDAQTTAQDTLTVTATSQSDPTVSHSFDIKVASAKQILETMTDETTGKLIAIDEAGNVIDVEQLIQQNEETTNSQTLTDENGNPMPGVTIQINDQTFVTDENGNWTMPQLPEGDYTITVSKDGKVLSSAKVNVGSDGEVIDVVESSPIKVETTYTVKKLGQGNHITYLITITNTGTETATGLIFTDTLPEDVELLTIKADSSGKDCHKKTASCELPDLAAGASIQVELVVQNKLGKEPANYAQVDSDNYPVAFDTIPPELLTEVPVVTEPGVEPVTTETPVETTPPSVEEPQQPVSTPMTPPAESVEKPTGTTVPAPLPTTENTPVSETPPTATSPAETEETPSVPEKPAVEEPKPAPVVAEEPAKPTSEVETTSPGETQPTTTVEVEQPSPVEVAPVPQENVPLPQPPVIVDSLPPIFEPACIATDTTIKDVCDYDGQTLTNVTVTQDASIANVRLAGNNINQGWISNVKILAGATLTGGTLTGYVNNDGLIADVHFRGGQLTGGTLSGVIRVRDKALIANVKLAVGTHIKGGKLSGKIEGDPNGPAILENVLILQDADLVNVIRGKGVIEQ